MAHVEVTDIYAKLSPRLASATTNGPTRGPIAHRRRPVKILDSEEVVVKGHVTHFRLLLTAWVSHFKSLGYVEDRTMDMLDRTVCKKIVSLTVRDIRVREAVGSHPRVWTDLVDLFRIASPSLEERSYGPLDQMSAGYDGPNSTIIVENSVSLLKDLQRLDNLLAIARNVLTAGEKVQNLAAQVGFDREVCAIINLCIKITARGYDGDGTNSIEEDRWQGVINGFKKLLITSLQFLSNLVTLNERLKLLLWVELFDSSMDHDDCLKPNPGADASRAPVNDLSSDAWVAEVAGRITDYRARANSTGATAARKTTDPRKQLAVYSHFIDSVRDNLKSRLIAKGEKPEELHATYGPLSDELLRQWSNLSLTQQQQWEHSYDQLAQAHARAWLDSSVATDGSTSRLRELLAIESPQDLMVQLSKMDLNERKSLVQDMTGGVHTKIPARKVVPTGGTLQPLDVPIVPTKKIYNPPAEGADQSSPPPKAELQSDLFAPPPFAQTDLSMVESAEDGARKLREGKFQLLKRLEAIPNNRSPGQDDSVHAANERRLAEEVPKPYDVSSKAGKIEDSSQLAVEDPSDGTGAEALDTAFRSDGEAEDELEDVEEGESEDDESDDSGYAIPGEDGRGLLTDVPLILGPNEIEVLPMVIMSGIVSPESETRDQTARKPVEPESKTTMNMYTIRCHLLLAQENGRNLLRELLIFVAAWDLREEELYFKFMVKIMEAILVNGLMPFAYGAFKESKDIISPAQAVIMKLLTKIFHSRQGFITRPRRGGLDRNTDASEASTKASTSLPPEIRYDVQIVHCLFTEFRQQIVPQICSLIFLQGQIRRGRAALEDFPLNLWDMERMYEGVYQYLEFFAILTDHEQWKKLLADWEVSSELVTLLRELELAIPKRRVMTGLQQHLGRVSMSSEALQDDAATPPLLDPGQAVGPLGDASDAHEPADGQSLPIQEKAPVSVELPYDVNGPSAPVPAAAISQGPPPPLPDLGETPATSQAAPHTLAKQLEAEGADGAAQVPYPSPPLHDEPADFEWRNLKKLCVLVLSSLVWKNPRLQEQVRHFGGVPVILSCCAADEHNPFIKEHAIMCLRFLVEGNAENEALVRRIAKRADRKASQASQTSAQTGHTYSSSESDGSVTEGEAAPASVPNTERSNEGPTASIESPQYSLDVPEGDIVDADFPSLSVPMEVLDPHGYETFMDVHGQVGLRRKEMGTSSGLQERLVDRLPASAPSEYPDITFGLDESIEDRAEGASEGEGVAKGGKKTGLLESIGGLPQWIKDMPPRS